MVPENEVLRKIYGFSYEQGELRRNIGRSENFTTVWIGESMFSAGEFDRLFIYYGEKGVHSLNEVMKKIHKPSKPR